MYLKQFFFYYSGYCLQVFLHHISNALLVTAVHVKMKLGDNTLNNEGLSLVKIKFPMKNYRIVALNFTALQYINPQRSPKKTFNLRKFNFLKNLSSS